MKKALILDPDHAKALTLLSQIHESAGHHAEALGYLRRLRKVSDEPTVIYNTGVIYNKMGLPANAVAGRIGDIDANIAGRRRKRCKRQCQRGHKVLTQTVRMLSGHPRSHPPRHSSPIQPATAFGQPQPQLRDIAEVTPSGRISIHREPELYPLW